MALGAGSYPEPPPEKPCPCCGRCHEALTQVYYLTDSGEEICEECFEEEKNDITLDELAKLKGYDKRWQEFDVFW